MKGLSVIIPVYNAEKYIEKAVRSVIIQPEVTEIIIVDDGSSDHSSVICHDLAEKYKRIKIYRHPDFKNHGRSATRNLGIKKAQGGLIAFLDADDYYLPDRFKNDLKIMQEEHVDGVYNGVSAHYYDSYKGEKQEWLDLTTFTEKAPPEHLFEKMSPVGTKGWLHADGLTIKKTVFQTVGLFDEQLKVAEDTLMWSKMALTRRLVPGIIDKPVAMRGIHDTNIIFNKSLYVKEKQKMYKSLLVFAYRIKADKSRIELIKNQKRSYLHKTYKYKLLNFLIKMGIKKKTASS